MSWLRHDDDMLDHPKWIRAIRAGGAEALLIWWRLCAWSSRRLTDGVIPVDMIAEVARVERSKSKMRALQALVDSALCARRDDGALVIVDYLERNPSKAEVLAHRDRRAKTQRDYTDRRKLTGQRPVVVIDDRQVTDTAPIPSRPDPVPIPERDPERAREFGDGVARTYSLPSAEPPKEFLDEALMGGVRPEQARSTWEHYHGAGLPERGIERPYPWLVKRALERQAQIAKAPPKGSPRGAVTIEPTGKHRSFAKKHGIDLGALMRRLDEQHVVEQVGAGRALEILGKWLSESIHQGRQAAQ